MKWGMLFLVFIAFGSLAQTNRDSLAVDLIELAKEQLGVPYQYATSNPGVSFDCSGFASYVYSSFDLPHSRSSKDYGSLGTPVALENCQPGDCMIFSGTAPGSTSIGHVGIVVSNDADGIRFIHCSSSTKHFGVIITDYYTSNYPERFLEVRRLF